MNYDGTVGRRAEDPPATRKRKANTERDEGNDDKGVLRKKASRPRSGSGDGGRRLSNSLPRTPEPTRISDDGLCTPLPSGGFMEEVINSASKIASALFRG